jgi:hypothetical protein
VQRVVVQASSIEQIDEIQLPGFGTQEPPKPLWIRGVVGGDAIPVPAEVGRYLSDAPPTLRYTRRSLRLRCMLE